MNFLQNYHKKRRFEGQYSSSKKKTRKSTNLIFLVFCCKYMKPSRKTIKPAPHKCPSRSTLMNVPHESSPSKTLITRLFVWNFKFQDSKITWCDVVFVIRNYDISFIVQIERSVFCNADKFFFHIIRIVDAPEE